jgi:hypothetical protein
MRIRCRARPGTGGSFAPLGSCASPRMGSLRGTDGSGWGSFSESCGGAVRLVFPVPASGSAYGCNLGAFFGAIDRTGIRTSVELVTTKAKALAWLAR